MTHAAIPKDEREKIGITDTLVRHANCSGLLTILYLTR